jgi:haloalkane dehalogenase
MAIVGLMKLLQSFERKNIDEASFQAYSQPFITPEECHDVIAFSKSIVTENFKAKKVNNESVAAVHAKTAIMIEGSKHKVLLAKHFVSVFKEYYPGRTIYHLENASHFLLEDEPKEISRLILEFIKRS